MSRQPDPVRRVALLLAGLCALIVLVQESTAQQPEIIRGRAFAQVNCARCHSIDKLTASQLSIAPPFRTLHQRYSVESLEEALAEGLVTGHPTMPEFQLAPDQASDFIAFLKSLEK